MGKIGLEKYVNTCVKRLQEKLSEELIIEYTNEIYLNRKDWYKDLATFVIYDVCRRAYKMFELLSEEDYNKSNDNKVKSLHFKAFQLAFPKAWDNITSKG